MGFKPIINIKFFIMLIHCAQNAPFLAWCLALTGGMEWKDLALGSMIEAMELSAWLTWIIGDYTSG
jgi:hypothetical protein